MDPTGYEAALSIGIDKYFSNGSFTCFVKPDYRLDSRWVTLAKNKYGQPVSGLIVPPAEHEANIGIILVLPQVQERGGLVVDLLEGFLPRIRSHLFPFSDNDHWTNRAEYDLPRIAALKSEIRRTEEAARATIRELEEKIALERERYGFLDDLLTATGGELVQAVMSAFKALGFNDVRDADADAQSSGDGQLREDLRIMDARIPVLVEVKGILGTPKEASSLQVAKYLAPRMREWKTPEIWGLSIVNHQRGLPALERVHEHVFQPDVVSTAIQQGFGLMTTWDLFRLTRGFMAHDWQHNDIRDIFIRPGIIRPIPAHYEHIGHIDGYWPEVSVLGLRITSGSVSVNDCIAYELPVDFVEETAASLEIDNRPVENATTGDHVAVKTALTKSQARKGTRVYKVAPRIKDDTATRGAR